MSDSDSIEVTRFEALSLFRVKPWAMPTLRLTVLGQQQGKSLQIIVNCRDYDSMKDDLRIKSNELSLDWLEKYPVWTWYEGSMADDENYICPIYLNQEFSDDFSIVFVKASFSTSFNQKLEGYIMCDIDTQEVYLASILWGNQEFIFNTKLVDLAKIDYENFKVLTDNQFNPLFPIQYQCDDKLKDVFPVKELFDPFSKD